MYTNISKNFYLKRPMNKFFPLSLSLIATSFFSGVANANFVEVSYEDWTLTNLSLSGPRVVGSIEVTDSYSLEVSTTAVDTTVSLGTAGIKYDGIGVGYTTELTDNIGLKVIVEHLKSNFWSETSTTSSEKVSGMNYEVSFTMGITDDVDGIVGISESNVAGATTNKIFGISLGVTENMDLTFSTSNSQVKIQSLGLRYNF